MGTVLDRINKFGILVSDGGLGTSLQAAGLKSGNCPEEWNISHPDQVRAAHRAFIDAGSGMILTNTFGGSRLKLEKFGLGERTGELNSAAVDLALEVSGGRVIVAGSIGPTGEFIAPLGTYTPEQMEEILTEQISAIISAGANAICVETQSSPEEAACAIRAAKKISPGIEVMATFTFEEGNRGFRTIMGTDIETAARAAEKAGADITGSNCGNGIEKMAAIVAEFRKHTPLPILVHANAGVPELEGGKTVFTQGPEEFIRGVPAVIEAGASIVGGCCGTGPEHIRAIKKTVG